MSVKLAGSTAGSKPGGLLARRAAAAGGKNPKMKAFANQLNLGGGSSEQDRLALIKQKGEQLSTQFEENKSHSFEAKYVLGKELGQGMHAQVF